MKTNTSVIIDGERVTAYGCATIQNACDLSGYAIPSSTNGRKLLKAKECLDGDYGVSISETPSLQYSNDQLVAYSDLVIYEDKGPLKFSNNQKLGVILGQLDFTEEACDPNPAFSSTNANQFSCRGNSIAYDKFLSSEQQDGYIQINISSTQLGVTQNAYSGFYTIVLNDFLDESFKAETLEIETLTGYNPIFDTSVSTNTYDIDAFDWTYGIDGSKYRKAVAQSDYWGIGATVDNTCHENCLSSTYSNFSNTSQLMIVYNPGSSTFAEYSDVLVGEIEVGLKYTGSDNIVKHRTLHITIFLKKPVGIHIPDLTPGDIEASPYTLFYRTSDSSEIGGLTDSLARSLESTNTLVSRGYDSTKDYGWITMQNVIQSIDGSQIFKENDKLIYVMWPTEMEEIKTESFQECQNLIEVSTFPSSIREIRAYAFYKTGILELNFSNLNNTTQLNISKYAFQYCDVTTLILCGILSVDDYAFADCSNLKTFEFPTLDGQVFPHGNYCFVNCVNLQTDILQYTIGSGQFFGLSAFENCRSLSKITINSFINWAAKIGDWIGMAAASVLIFPGIIADIVMWLQLRSAHDTFKNCTKLKTVIIIDKTYGGGSTTYAPAFGGFGATTFIGCTNVEEIYCNSQHPPYLGIKNIWKKGAINPQTCKLYVPTGRTAAYNSKAQWGDFPLENIIEYTEEQFENVKNNLS